MQLCQAASAVGVQPISETRMVFKFSLENTRHITRHLSLSSFFTDVNPLKSLAQYSLKCLFRPLRYCWWGGGALGNCFYLSPDAVSIAYVKF